MPERYTVEDVPAWMIDKGVGHIIAGPALSGWALWACGTITPCSTIETTIPARICRKCRAALAEARAEYLKTNK